MILGNRAAGSAQDISCNDRTHAADVEEYLDEGLGKEEGGVAQRLYMTRIRPLM
jgi:hypothetical protein